MTATQLPLGLRTLLKPNLGDIVYFDPPRVGAVFKAGEIFGIIEAVKTVSDLFMPLSGAMSEINPSIVDKADLLNSDPYEEGWIIKIKGFSLLDYELLLSASQYEEHAL